MVHDSSYFHHVDCLEELKRQFHELCLKLHPDMGGSQDEFIAMKRDYDRLFKLVRDTHKAANGSVYEKETTETADEFTDLIVALLKLNLVIEVCGSWVWVGGDTKAVKDDLKALGGRWSRDKGRWYFTPKDKGKRHRGWNPAPWDMERIRNTYGSREFRHEERGIQTA